MKASMRSSRSKSSNFERRSRRPPENELNALMSFGNGPLYTSVLSEIYRTHLDPRIGYLHTTNNRSFTFESGLGRGVQTDRRGQAHLHAGEQKADKSERLPRSLWKASRLKDSAKKLFVQAFEEKLKESVYSRRPQAVRLAQDADQNGGLQAGKTHPRRRTLRTVRGVIQRVSDPHVRR